MRPFVARSSTILQNAIQRVLAIEESLPQEEVRRPGASLAPLRSAADATTGDAPSALAMAALRSLHEAQHTGWIKRWRDERGV